MLERLQGKKIAIVGMGKNNRMLAVFLKQQGVDYEVIDGWVTVDELIGKLDFYDVIFRSPGLPFLSNPIQQAKNAGVEITSQTKLFFELCPSPIIGVTGTKGKGTTSSLIFEILKAGGKQVWLAGNIGRDPFEFVNQIQPDDFVVLELSSFQLQDLSKSAHIAVVLSITPDHLNHHRDFDEYIKAKSNIIACQDAGDFAVLHPTLPDWFKNLGEGKKILIEPKNASNFKTKLLGKHNWDNIAAAAEVSKILGIPEEIFQKAIAEFEALPHRLTVLRTVDNVTYVDDGFSTNVEPTMVALEAIDSKLILIIGGSEKGLDFTRLGTEVKKGGKVRGVVVIGSVTDKILKSLEGFDGTILTGAKTMGEILSQARQLAEAGDAVLFSPATASFDLFKNEDDRAEQFVKAVKAL